MKPFSPDINSPQKGYGWIFCFWTITFLFSWKQLSSTDNIVLQFGGLFKFWLSAPYLLRPSSPVPFVIRIPSHYFENLYFHCFKLSTAYFSIQYRNLFPRERISLGRKRDFLIFRKGLSRYFEGQIYNERFPRGIIIGIAEIFLARRRIFSTRNANLRHSLIQVSISFFFFLFFNILFWTGKPRKRPASKINYKRLICLQ